MNKEITKIIISILVIVTLGAASGAVTASAIKTWYITLNKPSFNPPNWIFAPAWTTLYILMGISFGKIWHTLATLRHRATYIFYLQFALNLLWSFLFFGLKNPAIALVEIVLMWFAILLTIKAFRNIKPLSSYLLYPYLAWVSFATLLNFMIWWLN
jgi:translocator protein